MDCKDKQNCQPIADRMVQDGDIEDLLVFMSMAKPMGIGKVDPSRFDASIPIFGGFSDAIAAMARVPLVFKDAGPDSSGKLANISVFNGFTSEPDSSGVRARPSMHAVECRRTDDGSTRINFLLGYLRKSGSLRASKEVWSWDGRSFALREYNGIRVSGGLALPRGNHISPYHACAREHDGLFTVGSAVASQQDDRRRSIQSMRILFGIHFTMFHEWTVRFRIPNSLSICLPAGPEAILDIFKDREMSPGKVRRTSLRHWVQEHLRRNPRDNDKLTYVRKHLRGAVAFFWRGFECTVRPDEDSLYQLEAASRRAS